MFPKRYWYVILTYILMHAFGVALTFVAIKSLSLDPILAINYANLISFTVALIIILLLMRPDMARAHERHGASISKVVLWSIIGVFLAYFAQIIAVTVEIEVFGIEPGSENTEVIMELTRSAPIFLIVPAIIAPILEEIVFRKIIFGSLYKRMNFLLAALISSFIFGIIHGEPVHLLIYGSMGFVFAFLYAKTKRIIVPIIVHMAMNSITVIVQLLIDPEDLERMQQQVSMILFGG